MNKQTIEECLKLSFSGTPFLEIVQRLAGAGVRSYRADLIQLEKTYYDGSREIVSEPLPLQRAPTVDEEFDQNEVIDALRAIQARQIDYPEFLRRVMRNGCASYDVYLAGRRAIYFGKDGQFYLENFPQPQ